MRPGLTGLLVSVGHLCVFPNHDCSFFFEPLVHALTAPENALGVKEKLVLVSVISESISTADEGMSRVLVPSFLGFAKRLLDAAESEDFLAEVLRLLSMCSTSPHISAHLGDIIDCVLGWRLDISTSAELVALIDGSHAALHIIALWLTRLQALYQSFPTAGATIPALPFQF